uniref:Uncharacterized protein n=1 Tax=Globisporangium ultimum (strain ATCC 200006 / CBS 805.95 / DAOM BR144) TaxID=431595 RepID=K3X8A5_GLOUD
MDSLFVRSLALAAPSSAEAHCLVSASRATADGTFAVASAVEGVIRVYAASCAALLHEFASIHRRIYALHYTSFSDSLVTLESDVPPRQESDGKGYEYGDDDDAETFLCVYHDWRERKMVRGYTLPLGVLESPSSKRKADCVAVCSFTGRVVIAMGTVLNIWQCSRGFFEHVMELKVDMSQQHAYLQVEFVAIHGVYVAYASQTEVRVMEIHVRSTKDAENYSSKPLSLSAAAATQLPHHDKEPPMQHDAAGRLVPDDDADCMNIATLDDISAFVDVPVPYGKQDDGDRDDVHEKRIFDEQDHTPLVLGRNEAQQEAWNLAGLVKSQDIRVNQALSYFVSEQDVHVLLQRFLPPNHCVRSLTFLPETIDNQVSVEARSYTRLLVATEKNAFLYYFLSQEADLTRKKMAKKLFGKGERGATKSRGMHKPIKVGKVVVGKTRDSFASLDDDGDDDTGDGETDDGDTESGRVVMHYTFSSPVSCITANSSFLFAATLSGLQVWSIWSPCHYVAASRALSTSLVPQPAQPQLLCTQPLPFPVSQIAALDSYVVLLPRSSVDRHRQQLPRDFIRMSSLVAADRLPESEFEMRYSQQHMSSLDKSVQRNVLIFQQSPPSLIFSYVRKGIVSSNKENELKASQIDLLLSLFSLYRYRADVGFDVLHLHNTTESVDYEHSYNAMVDEKEKLALELETRLYDTIAKACAADLAEIFTSESHRNLTRAALLYVASNVPSSEVMHRLQAIMGADNRSEVIDATGKYLEAFVFPSPEALPSVGSSPKSYTSIKRSDSANERDFTRTVLLHYGKYAPEQLSRLIVDSTLVWSLEDIEFALEKLAESSSQSVLVKIGTLVLILRASSFSSDEWDTFKQLRESAGAESLAEFLSTCSYESMSIHVKHLLTDHLDALVHLSVTHPEFLVQTATNSESEMVHNGNRIVSSSLAQALLENAPLVLLQILERVFNSAVRRQEAVFSSLLFCLSVIGEAAELSIQRLTSYRSFRTSDNASSSSAATATPFVGNQTFVLRFLVFVLETFPTLETLVDKDELHDDEDDLKRVKAAIGMELMTLCVKLSSSVGQQSTLTIAATNDSRIEMTLLELFHQDGLETQRYGMLPEWVHEYLETRCLSNAPESLRACLRFLFNLTLVLQQEADLISPTDVLSLYDADVASGTKKKTVTKKKNKTSAAATPPSPSWNLENNFAALIVLLTLPRVSRTIDGLQLIAARTDFINLFLPYGKCYCVTLEEWRFLIKTLSDTHSTEYDDASSDEAAILESVLNHICSTLGPEDLLLVLPDDGDLAMYMATLEASVRLDEAREKTRGAQPYAHAVRAK